MQFSCVKISGLQSFTITISVLKLLNVNTSSSTSLIKVLALLYVGIIIEKTGMAEFQIIIFKYPKSDYSKEANEKYEYRLLNSGITGLTDNLDPNYTWYKNGKGARWQKPATKPLDAQQIKLIENADYATHKDVIKQLEHEVSPWIECNNSRKRELIKMWKFKWNWDVDVDKLVDNSSHSPPWESVRLIGHRGSGKTARPVLQ